MTEIKWPPLKSDPSVMNLLLKNLGVPEKYQISDVLCFDDEYLRSFSDSVLGLLLLFPVPENYIKMCADQKEMNPNALENVDPDVYFLPQTIKNACGAVAMIHAIANNMKYIQFEKGSALKNFIKKTYSMSPKKKAQELEKSKKIKDVVEETVWQGQGEISSSDVEDPQGRVTEDEASNHHYIALVNVNSNLYELDGYKHAPVNHGATSKNTFLIDAARVCQDYIKRDPSKLSFSALVFSEI